MRFLYGLTLCVLAALLALPTISRGSTGVSDERVVLPDGPGSIGGIGENAEIDPNSGSMRYSVKIEVPYGYKGLTPKLKLSYDSSAGASEVGVGWSMDSPHIERMSLRGLPKYDTTDLFAADGGGELVLVDVDGETRTFRKRFEDNFVRYKWQTVGDGSAGYFTAEYPDGSIGYFGADRTGTAVPTAQVANGDGDIFRYLLVDKVDPFGHRITYTYTASGNYPLVDTIGYVYGGGANPRFSVRYTYEDRGDALSNCIPGFDLLLTQRLSGVNVYSDTEAIRRYALAYESDETSGGVSRLAKVTRYGRGDVKDGVDFTFGYSRSLGGTCTGSSCEGPYMVDMGSLTGGVDMSTGKSTLLDINGDALPDVLHTDEVEGKHYFYINSLDDNNQPKFDTAGVESAITNASAFILATPGVQVLDVNGDGFVDIISAKTGDVACNFGTGDWGDTSCLSEDADATDLGIPDGAGQGEDPNPTGMRFFDYDNDKRIDLLRTSSVSDVSVSHNQITAFTPVIVDAIGAVFDSSRLELSDMNGDGLQDPVVVLTGGVVSYKLNLGFGIWEAAFTEVTLDTFSDTDLDNTVLEDINGDGLSDVVVVTGNVVKYWINRNGDRFDAMVTLASDGVDGDIPTRASEVSVLFADMNGSGSRDVVWITNTSGKVEFLELFPVKPNLLARIENGIGWVQTTEFGTSVVEQARDKANAPWQYKLPHAMNVVTAADSWVTLTGGEAGAGLHNRLEYTYHSGFYDGVEKAFRGYQEVETKLLGDDESQEPAMTYWQYDVGASDLYYNGKLKEKAVFALNGATEEPLVREISTWSDCPVAEATAVDDSSPYVVKFICQTSSKVVKQERGAEATWATIETTMAYDGYGNVTNQVELGVVNLGSPENPQACGDCTLTTDFSGPCGPTCLGDEKYTDTSCVVPGTNTGGAWFLRNPYLVNSYGAPGDDGHEDRTYYDGEPFVGLDEGQLTKGSVTRTTRLLDDSGTLIEPKRASYDANGNVVESIEPTGTVDNADADRRTYTWDALGLNVIRVQLKLANGAGTPYILRREMTYESAFNLASEATSWMVVQGDEVLTGRNSGKYRYGPFGRVSQIILPGDTDEAPTVAVSYTLESPASRVVALQSLVAGGAETTEIIKCHDGQGRVFQQRTKISDERYIVSGFTTFNRQGSKVRVYQPYESTSGACEQTPPEGVLSTSFTYDGLGRQISVTSPDEGIYETASVQTTVYGPLTKVQYDNEDNDSTGLAYNTPTVEYLDGLGRLYGLERYLADIDGDATSGFTRLVYDDHGDLVGVIDPAGNEKRMTYDKAGRIVQVDDPNTGQSTRAYDASGNILELIDARGITVNRSYDSMNRILAVWNPADETATKATWEYDFSPACTDCTNGANQLVRQVFPLGGDRGQGIDETGFDPRGNPMFKRRVLEGNAFTTTLTYDNASRLTEIVHPDGTTEVAGYDGVGRTVSIDGVLSAITYDAKGLVSGIDFANGAREARTYDDMMRLATQSTTDAADAVLQGRTFSRNRMGHLLNVADTSAQRAGRPSLAAAFTYDPWYRTLSASLAAGADGEETVSYTYDLIDNILSKTSSLAGASSAHVGDYAYDGPAPNGVTLAGTITLDYDESGNVATRADQGLTWDYQGRLTSVTGAEEETALGEFVYGPDNERVMKLEEGGAIYYINDSFEIRDGIGVTYPKLGRTRVARIQTASLATTLLSDVAPLGAADGAITAADAWLSHAGANSLAGVTVDDASDPGRLLRSAARRLLHEDGAAQVSLHGDYLGSITLATDSSGALLGERAFHLNGEVRAESAYVDVHGFTGQEMDDSTGLIHFQNRYLDPQLGRWSSSDPGFATLTPSKVMKQGEATTGYAYVANNAANNFDPTGLNCSPTHKGPAKAAAPASKEKKDLKKVDKIKVHLREKAVNKEIGKQDAAKIDRNATVLIDHGGEKKELGKVEKEIAGAQSKRKGDKRAAERDKILAKFGPNLSQENRKVVNNKLLEMQASTAMHGNNGMYKLSKAGPKVRDAAMGAIGTLMLLAVGD